MRNCPVVRCHTGRMRSDLVPRHNKRASARLEGTGNSQLEQRGSLKKKWKSGINEQKCPQGPERGGWKDCLKRGSPKLASQSLGSCYAKVGSFYAKRWGSGAQVVHCSRPKGRTVPRGQSCRALWLSRAALISYTAYTRSLAVLGRPDRNGGFVGYLTCGVALWDEL